MASRLVSATKQGARAFLRAYRGGLGASKSLSRIDANGEAALLTALRGTLGVVFDVGGNIGDWTQHALNADAARVHAFEISPATSAKLAQRYASEPRVTVNQFGLSDAAGSVTIHHYEDFPVLTTMTEYPHDMASVALEVPVRTGDAYVAEHGIDRIDFLKLDVEGAEPRVLAGFAAAFDNGAIGAVQIEYGRVSILTKYLLHDFYADMTKRGFRVGRVLPNGVRFSDYDMAMENFHDSNWLAVHETRADLIARVS